MMAKSLLFKLQSHNQREGVKADPHLFKEAYTSKHNLVRIFKVLGVDEESKAWAKDPSNRVCDAPGSWYCNGQYPPAIRPLLERRKDFKQLEDFNTKGDSESDEYQKAYHSQLASRDES